MTHKSIFASFSFGIVGSLVFIYLFNSNIFARALDFVNYWLRVITSVSRDPTSQWEVVCCLVVYFVTVLILKRRLGNLVSGERFLRAQTKGRVSILFRNYIVDPDLWLTLLAILALLRYALAYDIAARSMQVLVLMATIVFGNLVAIWVKWRCKLGHFSSSRVLVGDDKARPCCIVSVIYILLFLLAASALYQPGASNFQYHAVPRWSGLWNNPNLYGLLMGVGVILAIAQITGGLTWKINYERWQMALHFVLCGIALVFCSIGLFESYSRGAWLGTVIGLIYFATKAKSGTREDGSPKSKLLFSSWFIRNRLSLVIIFISISALACWQLRFSEFRPAQRLFSIGNTNDFSWRNRVIAWEGAARMMIDKPYIGFGWAKAETDYSSKYLPSRLIEGAAIEMNDYFMIGISVGVPAMICFVMYIWSSLRSNWTSSHSELLERNRSVQVVCRAGAVVLLVGFWFDGGLFKLPVAVVFWILIELGRIELPVEGVVPNLTLKITNQLEASCILINSKKANWLRWVAGVLAAIALIQSILLEGTPWLPVNEETLVMARMYLVSPKQQADFAYLSISPIWHGQKIKVLLEHVQLAGYNRELINWRLDSKIYRDYVLSPFIQAANRRPLINLNWRRPLWEEFYPRIRYEFSPTAAAQIVVRHLRELVTMAGVPNQSRDVPAIWLDQLGDSAAFEVISVAALRSVGIPSRLGLSYRAEIFDGYKWSVVSNPAVVIR